MKRSPLIFVFILVSSGLCLTAGPAQAGPDCTDPKHADKPACGGGGGGGGGEDPPANPAFVHLNTNRDRIEFLDADGSNPTSLLDGIYRLCTYPKWSPDGTQVAFAQTTGEVYVLDADGSGLSDLRAGSGVAWAGSCSLDWSQGPVLGGSDLIAFVGEPEGIDEPFPDYTDYDDVFLVDPSSGDLQKLTDSIGVSEGFLSWSPDGGRLAVGRNDYGNDIWTLWVLDLARRADDPSACLYSTLDTDICVTSETEITPWADIAPSIPISWASEHDWIMMGIDGDLFYVDLDNNNAVVQVTGGSGQFDVGYEIFPTWSPDDTEIAFTVYANTYGKAKREAGLYRMDLATGVTERISGEGPRWADWKPTWTESP